MHLFGGRARREIPSERLDLDFQIFFLIAFDFGHDLRDTGVSQCVVLAKLAEALCLRQRRRNLVARHDLVQDFLLVIIEIGMASKLMPF